MLMWGSTLSTFLPRVHVLQARRIEDQRPTHPRSLQIDRRLLASAGGGEPVAEIHVLAGLHAVGDQGGPESLRRSAPAQSSWPPM